jgi:hypothetical protein
LAARANPSKGGKPDKLMRDALILALHRTAKDGKTKRLHRVANALVGKAADGDVAAIKEIFDRVDGKAIQQISGPEGGPIEIEAPSQRVPDIEFARRIAFLLTKAERQSQTARALLPLPAKKS